MAIVTYPPGSPGLNRSFQGSTFSANFNGSIIRGHKKGVNYKSIRNSIRRSKFMHLVQHWRTLDQSTKDEWTDVRLNFPRINSLGETYYLNGFQLFVSWNQVRLNQELEIIDQPEVKPTFPNALITDVAFDIDPVDIDVTFSGSPVPTNFEYRFWATAILSDGKELVWPDSFKLVHTIYPGESSQLALGPYWILIFGSGPSIILTDKTPWVVFVALEIYSPLYNHSQLGNQFKALVTQ